MKGSDAYKDAAKRHLPCLVLNGRSWHSVSAVSPSSPPEAFWRKSSNGDQEKKEASEMNDVIYVLLSLGLFAAFAVAIFGYERVE